MNFYQQQIKKISEQIYPKDYLCTQVIQSKRFIDNHYADNIDLQHMAAAAFVSKFHFIRLFKKNYGRTPYQYLTEVRIAKAKAFLRSGTDISDTCLAVGFNSVTSFTGLFKKITGYTPLAFSKKAILKNDNCKSFPIFEKRHIKNNSDEDKINECNGRQPGEGFKVLY